MHIVAAYCERASRKVQREIVFRMHKHPRFAVSFESDRSEGFDDIGKRFIIGKYKIGVF
jgi:hypothetical protein